MIDAKNNSEIVLTAHGLCKTYPDSQTKGVVKALDHLDLTVREGEILGILGPNGAGKTTVFRIIAKQEGVDAGSVSIPDKLVIGYFSQDVGEMKGRSALEEVEAGAGRVSELGA